MFHQSQTQAKLSIFRKEECSFDSLQPGLDSRRGEITAATRALTERARQPDACGELPQSSVHGFYAAKY